LAGLLDGPLDGGIAQSEFPKLPFGLVAGFGTISAKAIEKLGDLSGGLFL
jgi:hypothetical protein